MCLLDLPFSTDDLLRAYHHDQPTLFLSTSFMVVAILTAGFCVIRRRFDPLLVCFALFAYLYGQRLRFESHVLWMIAGHNAFFIRLEAALNYLVPIPAFAFFEAVGFLGHRGKSIVIVLSAIFLSLVTAVFVVGPLPGFELFNHVLIIVTIPAVALRSFLARSRERDATILQIGLTCFVVAALWDNIVGALSEKLAGTFWGELRIEPYGFVVLLAALGYVAARRLLRRDQELNEIRSELELARHIQLSILPRGFPESVHFRVGARYLPMTSVAGDFYDFLHIDAARAGILIADVSGHGVPAALIASMVKMAAISQREQASEPAKVLTGMNNALCGNTQNQFVTAAFVYLDAQAREFRYAAAGHPPMLLLRSGQVTEILENGLILAISETAGFTQRAHSFEPGDRLVLYTDGVLEAADSDGAFFGTENLHTAVRKTSMLPPMDAASEITGKIKAWSKNQDDDLTLIICDFVQQQTVMALAN